MNLENYACSGVAGRVSTWVMQQENILTDILEEGVQKYVAKNSDPYVLDTAPEKYALLLRVPTSAKDKIQSQYFQEFKLCKRYPAVPCVLSLQDAGSGDREGYPFKVFPLSLFEERFKACADLLTRLVQCELDYCLASQKLKKEIFQTLFSEDDADLTEILEDEA